MSQEPTDLKASKNQVYRLFSEFNESSKAITIAKISLVAALLSVLLSLLAFNDAKYATVAVNYELEATREELAKLKEEVELWELILMKQGITKEEQPE